MLGTRVGERSQIDDGDVVAVAVRELLRDSQCDRGLADAAWTGDRDEVPLRHALHEGVYRDVAPDDPHGRGRAAGRPRRACRSDSNLFIRRARERRYEAVAAAGHVEDVSSRAWIITQCLAQRRDVDPERGVIDVEVRPDTGNEVFLADQLACPLNQGKQDLERAAA